MNPEPAPEQPETQPRPNRRSFLLGSATLAAAAALPPGSARTLAVLAAPQAPPPLPPQVASGQRPAPADRRFHSPAVEQFLTQQAPRIANPELRRLFLNCFPNTLDTTVEPGTFEGKPDTAVVTGDIAAMWLRDSSAQVWPYLPLAKQDPALRQLLAGLIRRQARCLLIDPYANAFMADLSAPPLEWSRHDRTELKQGVGERKYELDSLCYPIRLAHGFWRATGDTSPFDSRFHDAMRLVVQTMRVQQRKPGGPPNPYHFQREAWTATDTLANNGLGYPANPVGLIACEFRPSDDSCLFPFLVPSNYFAVASLRQLAALANQVLHDPTLANDAHALAEEVASALAQYAPVQTQAGTILAYEVDGFGSHALMDDANVPSLLGLPYLEAAPDAALYARTRSWVWSQRNPWFFQGTDSHGVHHEGVGGPHEGTGMIWPMSQIIYALTGLSTSISDAQLRSLLAMLVAGSAGSGFIHESYRQDDPSNYTRAWFAWANTLFGELVATLLRTRPALLAS